MRLRHVQWDVVLVTTAVLLVGVGYLGWRLTAPAACPWVGPDAASWTPIGLAPRLPADCVLPTSAPIVGAAPGASEVRLQFADGASATLPLTDPVPLVGQRLLQGAWTLLFTVLLLGLTAFAFARRPDDRGAGAALVFSTGLLTSTTVTIVGLPASAAFTEGPRWLFMANTQGVFSLVWGAALLLVVQFPTPMTEAAGRFRHRAAVASAPLVLWLVLGAAILATTGDLLARANFAIRAQTLVTLFTMLALAGIALARMIRLRVALADVVARQQLLWVGTSGLSSLLLTLSFWIVPHAVLGGPLLPDDLIGVPGLVFVVGLGVALLRFRMFELEWLLVRVLVDTTLLLLAVGVYVALLTGIEAAGLPFDAVTAGVVATIAVALATPALRHRIELVANWIVYRDPESPYHTLSQVAEALAGRTVDFQRVTDDIRRALRLPHVLVEAEGVAAASGDPDGVPGSVPVRFPLGRGADDGGLVVRTRGRGDRLTDSETRLLYDLGRQIGTAVHQLRLSAELQRSREQLVLAREEERRAIRRVMHDDIAPTLAGLTLQAETARQLAQRHPDLSDALAGVLATIGRDASATSRALRELAYDLRPPALDERGLVAALEDACAQLAPVAAELDTHGLADPTAGPLPAAVEVAVYRIATEALRNVARHAAATTCRVTVRRSASALELEVADDGVGLPEGVRAGVGLTSMRERAAELGGTFAVGRGPRGGTVLRVRLPLGGAT